MKWIIVALSMGVLALSAHAQQPQQQGDDRAFALLGKCQIVNSINFDKATELQQQLTAEHERGRATADYWARYIGWPAETEAPK